MSGVDTMETRELVKASAGSGKTYQLTDRFIYLILRDFKPESIVALTFSRKAAGEFFDAILRKLAEAAKDDRARSELENKFGFEIPRDLVREKISTLLGAMNRLTLGTLDSFFFSVLSSAPLEHGLAVGFDLMDEASIRERWTACLRQCFEESIGESSLLIEAFARARMQSEDREFFPWVLELAISFRELFDRCPNPGAWGGVDDIWPDDSPWKLLPERYDYRSDCARCRSLFNNDEIEVQPELTEAAKKALGVALHDFESWTPGADLDRMKTGFRSLLKECGSKGLSISFKSRKDYEIFGELVPAIRRMSAYVVGEELRMCGARTQGIFSLLKKVVASYKKLVLERGGVTFSDLPLLLGHSEDELAKLNREYRLDRKYSHWMLDEFQDTSPGQWEVIEPLVEDVINEDEDFRMFFCVGDQKQAIYGWRGGDSRVFGYLEEKFRGRLAVNDMNLSWRSGQDVLGAVNQVFGAKSDPEVLVPRWKKSWKLHEASPKTQNLSGQVAWWTSSEEEDRMNGMVHLLRTIDPVQRGWTCAILTQKRKTARALVDFLRRELPGMPVEDEVGALPAKDNGFSQFLLSLLRACAHPTDQWAMGHLRMCPFIDADELPDLLNGVKKMVMEKGFAHFVKEWGKRALKHVDNEAKNFANRRMHETLALAVSLDRRGTKNIDLFIEAAQRSEASRGAMESSIRAMTIHGSKGLTFDMVIMPELDGDGLRSVGGHKSDNGIELYRSASASGIGFDWVLAKPKKIIQEADPHLSCQLDSDEQDAAFESLCKFYVGMTRPARGLYLFSDPYNPKSKSKNFIYLLAETLAEDYGDDPEVNGQVNQLVGDETSGLVLTHHSGNPEWWQEKANELTVIQPEESKEVKDLGHRKYRALSPVTPSRKVTFGVGVKELISAHRGTGQELGTEVHHLFERIEWWGSEVSVDEWINEHAPGKSATALGIFKRAMSDSGISKLFFPPPGKSEVWMERSFALQVGGTMIQGTFDRVVLKLGENGEAEEAEITDFKTDRLPAGQSENDLKELHREQLERYRQALQHLTGLPPGKICMTLLFTSLPKAVTWK